MTNNKTVVETHNGLSSDTLEYIYKNKLFKLFVPEAYKGLACALPDGLEYIFQAGQREGNLGWCVNLGAGAGYFSGFFNDDAAKEIFSDEKGVIAGSGMDSGTYTFENDKYTINGKWGKCTGAAHATYFTVNAVGIDGKTKSFAIPRQLVTIRPTWGLFALKDTTSFSIEVNDATIDASLAFDIGEVINPHAYAIHKMDFMLFARYCMAAAYYGLVDCFADKIAGKFAVAAELKENVAGSWHQLMVTAVRHWQQLEADEAIQDQDELQQKIAVSTKKLFDHCMDIFYKHGIHLAEEQSEAHHALKNVMLASQHGLLK